MNIRFVSLKGVYKVSFSFWIDIPKRQTCRLDVADNLKQNRGAVCAYITAHRSEHPADSGLES
jgi:hypothetical protein